MMKLFRYTISLVLLGISLQHSAIAMERDDQDSSQPRRGDIGYLPGQQPSTESAQQEVAQEDWRDDSSQESEYIVGNVGYLPGQQPIDVEGISSDEESVRMPISPRGFFVGESSTDTDSSTDADDDDYQSVEIFADDQEDPMAAYAIDPAELSEAFFMYTDSEFDVSSLSGEEEYDIPAPSSDSDDSDDGTPPYSAAPAA